ncbi:TAXI family TRAP transporter solute-binding subunit [Pseudorhodobacter sp. MZDSW-24AT]|uniref:TAXI family TRAP transporter solute-binding subunit n=1 Tax=Pseudorhodobacter sp. MZDSW-24AT TaxID=2052957 RepID=UPI000C1E56CB|nr:TAXI family TRAP transporter solute-binding subunit [Pseudorhodobacter sp. MZDSW-24AT]PJF09368.1 C4-dicarboxylate ABC transporter substrate-binding protein [Pseudorhodobacter sp. MZDSW-24AT]
MKLTTAATLVAGAMLALPASAQDREGWPSSLSISTGSQGGAYFVWGSGFASLIGERLGISTSVEVTGGPGQNVALVETAETLLGFVTTGPAQEAMQGESELMPGMEASNLRALFPMYQTPLQAAVLSASGISSFEDLEGKRVNMGPASGTSATYWQRYFETTGMTINASFAGASDAAGQMADGLIDAFVFAAGLPTGAFSQLAVEQQVTFLSMSDANVSTFLEAVPSMQPFTIPAGTYNNQDYEVNTVSMWNFAIAHASVPDSLAYEITKLALEDNARIVQIHASAVEALAENWDKNNFMPFHPGAVRYYEEIGISIPEELR